MENKEWHFKNAFLTAFVVVFLIFPPLFFGTHFPMAAGTWEIQDPAVSELVYVPGLEVVRQALFKEHQLFWSSLRGMGQPLLGNEVQAAPLFPLTWVSLLFPEPLFFHVFCLLRFILIGTFSLLVANQILGFSQIASFVFMVCFGFSVYALRWINHAWLNGLLAGLLYFYAHGLVLARWNSGHPMRPKYLLFLSFSVFCMLTCGFPESALMSGLLSLFVFLPRIFISMVQRRLRSFAYLFFLVLTHLTGAALASPQVLALIEYLKEQGTGLGESFRTGPGAIQFPGIQTLYSMVTRLLDGPPPGEAIHFFNLIPLFFFILGLGATFRRKKMSVWDFGTFLCFLFCLFKLFPTWPAFNEASLKLPLFGETWFIVYFLSLLIWVVAFFAAKGVQEIESGVKTKRLVGSFLVVSLVLLAVLPKHVPINWWRTAKLFLIFGGLVAFVLWGQRKRIKPLHLKIGIALFLVSELISVRPIHFLRYQTPTYDAIFSGESSIQFKEALEKAGVSLLDSRDQSNGGRFVSIGLGTMNNGSPPIVTRKLGKYLSTLFYQREGWGSAMPVLEGRFGYSYPLSGVNVYFDPSLKFPLARDSRKFEKLGVFGGKESWVDRTALPRAYLASRCLAAANSDAAFNLLTKPRAFQIGMAVVEGLNSQERSVCRGIQRSVLPMKVVKDEGSRLSLSNVRGPGVVVLSDLQYPGWRAYDRISGAPLPVKNGNGIFRAVLLPSHTEYQIEFEYVPTWWSVATTLLVFGVLLLCVQILFPLLKWHFLSREKVVSKLQSS